MTNETIFLRPKWMKILIGIFCGWSSFIISLIILFIIFWAIQIKLLEIEIEGTPAFIILLTELIISAYAAFRITKWQNIFLDKKPLKTSYYALVVLILISIIIPLPMTYMIF